MNRFMYLYKRNFSMQCIKSLYPKCINCINFEKDPQTCKKIVLTENYINYDSHNELAVNVRSDNKKCGEAGNLFQVGEEELKKENKQILNIFYITSMLTSLTCFITEASTVTLLPLSLNFFSLFIFLEHSQTSQKKIDDEKKELNITTSFIE